MTEEDLATAEARLAEIAQGDTGALEAFVEEDGPRLIAEARRARDSEAEKDKEIESLRAQVGEREAAARLWHQRADDAEAAVAALREKVGDLREALDSELDEVYAASTEEAFRAIRALARHALAFRRSQDAAEAREAKALEALRLAWDPHAYSCGGRQGETCTCGAAELLR